MSGHSKWATTKHHKAKQDAQRSKIFMKLAKEITVAARDGADPIYNSKLKLAIVKAKAKSLPVKNIQRAIEAGSNTKNASNFTETLYEARLPHGIALLIQCLSDNNNRTNANIKALLKKMGGSLGSVKFMFERFGVIEVANTYNDEEIMEKTINYLENFEETNDSFMLYSLFTNFQKLKECVEAMGITEFKTAEIRWIAKDFVEISDEQLDALNRHLNMIIDDDDVQDLYVNIDQSLLDITS